MAWDLELSAFAPVIPEVLTFSPLPITLMMSSTLETIVSVIPTMFTFFVASSLHYRSTL